MNQVTNLQRLDAIAWSVEVDGKHGIAFVPTREFIDSLKAGDLAPNCFGNLSTVSEIRYVGKRERDGAHFIGYWTPLGNGGQVSQSITENEVVRGVSCPWDAAQFNAAEDAIRKSILS